VKQSKGSKLKAVIAAAREVKIAAAAAAAGGPSSSFSLSLSPLLFRSQVSTSTFMTRGLDHLDLIMWKGLIPWMDHFRPISWKV